ncbi:MAG: hypothetical protein AAGC99_15290 [Pseudomonadota bacterium]
MMDNPEHLNWSVLARSYGKAERALGELAHALQTTPLHATWLWREITRTSVIIAQIRGYRVRIEQLRMTLIGAPLGREDETPGLAAAKRIFIAAEPSFRTELETDSKSALLPIFWRDEDGAHGQDGWDETAGMDGAGEVAWPQQADRKQLQSLVRELVCLADDGRRPALISLLIGLRKHSAHPATRRLPTPLIRLALPLALSEAGLLPKAAPGLLGGARLPLGMSRAVASDQPLTEWLKGALEALADEAYLSSRRLLGLMRQHQAWHRALAEEGLRKHALAPRALDLLAATPVMTIGLVARHVGCSHVAAGKITERLVEAGILIEQTSRSRHKVFVAGDLSGPAGADGFSDGPPLSFSEPAPAVDMDAVGATLSGLFADIDRLNKRAEDRIRTERPS